MVITSLENTKILTEITERAEREIRELTGLDVMIYGTLRVSRNKKTIDDYLRIVARALDMDVSDYKKKSRVRDFVDLRCLAATMIRNGLPHVSLNDIGRALGVDHTSIYHYLERNDNLLSVNDELYHIKTELVLNAIY